MTDLSSVSNASDLNSDAPAAAPETAAENHNQERNDNSSSGFDVVGESFPLLAQALEQKGYKEPTLVQQKVIDPALNGRDLLVSARTGSGKTVAFGLAFAADILDASGRAGNTDHPQVLVIAPTRELAQQVRAELEWLYKFAAARVVCCIGGSDARLESKQLKTRPHIVVGTPGRLCDHLSRGNLDLSHVKVAVLDEADEMLDMGFRDELETLLNALPKSHRSLFFSATMASEIVKLAKSYQKDALRIAASDGQTQHSDIAYECVGYASRMLEPALVNILRFHEAKAAMIFCNTRMMVRDIQAFLVEKGFSSVAISGEMGQNERTRAIEALRQGQAHVCVATDVAARGLDVPELSLVIHTALPKTPETLLHRSGRTGRAGRKGTSVILLPFSQKARAQRLLRTAKIEANWVGVPTRDMILEQDGKRIQDSRYLAESAAPLPSVLDDLCRELADKFGAEKLAKAFIRASFASQPDPIRLPAGDWGSMDSPRGSGGWFQIDKGRNNAIEPKSFLAWLERVSGLSARDVGDIRIQPDCTNFEIKPMALASFEEIYKGLPKDDGVISKIPAPKDAQRRAPRTGGPRAGGFGGPRKSGFGGGRPRFKSNRK